VRLLKFRVFRCRLRNAITTTTITPTKRSVPIHNRKDGGNTKFGGGVWFGCCGWLLSDVATGFVGRVVCEGDGNEDSPGIVNI